jgi:AcrR family transcriptional regulator
MRWEPDARGRLERAALELYGERGFEQTTVAGIAERAGLTERTFFRHFADKREVLFSGAGELQEFLVSRVEGAPASQPALERVLVALVDAAREVFEERRDFARRRQAIIAATAELRERELIKLARLADALADALRRGGVPDPTAGLAAEAGIAVFRVAFERWTAQAGDLPLAQVIRESSAALHAVTHEAGTAAQQTAGRPARAART